LGKIKILHPQKHSISYVFLGLATRYGEVHRPGDSEGIFSVFQSICHLLP